MFAPDSGCEYFQYTRGEVLEYFQGEATDILVVGDSFMRQLFVRLTHLLRGQVRDLHQDSINPLQATHDAETETHGLSSMWS